MPFRFALGISDVASAPASHVAMHTPSVAVRQAITREAAGDWRAGKYSRRLIRDHRARILLPPSEGPKSHTACDLVPGFPWFGRYRRDMPIGEGPTKDRPKTDQTARRAPLASGDTYVGVDAVTDPESAEQYGVIGPHRRAPRRFESLMDCLRSSVTRTWRRARPGAFRTPYFRDARRTDWSARPECCRLVGP